MKTNNNAITFYNNLIFNNYILLNNKAKTHFNHNTDDTAIDLSFIKLNNNLKAANWNSNWHGNTRFSDHYEITFDITHCNNSFPEQVFEAWNFNQKKEIWDEYRNKIKDFYLTWKIPNDISKAVEIFTLKILEIAHATIGTHQVNTNTKPFWSKKLEDLHKIKKNKKNRNNTYIKRHKCHWNHLPKNMLDEYLVAYNNFYDEYNNNKEIYNKKINEYLINCSQLSERKFWNIVNSNHNY